ncbi:MAG: hypothetical protein KAY24_18325 [Candidatus Eisenbacteria sp.]|nr:hypothetical protein [Candidatus Eisenbacteria bacterium]
MRTKPHPRFPSLLVLLGFAGVPSTARAEDQQVFNVYTPGPPGGYGSEVDDCWELDEFEHDWFIEWLTQKYAGEYPNATVLGPASRKYNCHALAWHMSAGGDSVWMGRDDPDAEDIYWEDGSYVPEWEYAADKISYVSSNHSAITTATPSWFISKWGPGPLMFHECWDCPYDASVLQGYILNPGSAATPTSGDSWVYPCDGGFNGSVLTCPNNGEWELSYAEFVVHVHNGSGPIPYAFVEICLGNEGNHFRCDNYDWTEYANASGEATFNVSLGGCTIEPVP